MIQWRPIEALAMVSLVACGGSKDWNDTAAEDVELTRKVIFVGIDGLRGDGIPGSETPNMDRLTEGGTWTIGASTQLQAQTVSGPGWTSMLTGVDSNKHGITENGGWEQIDRTYPTLIGRAHDVGLSTVTAINWLPIQLMIIERDVTDEVIAGDDEAITGGMVEVLEDGDFDVHFVALDDVDHAGHSTGFSLENPDYVNAIETADARLGQLLSAIEARPTRSGEDWMVLITSDHGGSGTSHGALDADCRTIPLIVWGDSVRADELAPGVGSHLDIHPTLMAHMGHPAQPDWSLDGEARGQE
jgi:predicted AlkP superfamily pyrophosphatase or phosphodiesterase